MAFDTDENPGVFTRYKVYLLAAAVVAAGLLSGNAAPGRCR